ncbi:hypothetical protein [Sphingomonas mesophila]|uniref:hypothetical protein n=1 Tax=Sphingomonas mesophila TaxID=2303576 RepID=UPI0013C2D7BD|nr:hypothetical protein [Sphingomonas mesophila]
MPIDLTDSPGGELITGQGEAVLGTLRDRITRAQARQVAGGGRAIVVLEGLEGSLKAQVARQLAAALDPRFLATHNVRPDRRRSGEGHWLARFWRDLPANGRTALYVHSWYHRVLEDRVLGLAEPAEWGRAHDEINEFESQQRDHGTLILKLLFHVTEAVRARRLTEQAADAAAIPAMGPEELRGSQLRGAYDEALTHMLAQNNMRWSPWVVVDADKPGGALVSALTAVANGFEAAFVEGKAGQSPAVPLRRARGKTD